MWKLFLVDMIAPQLHNHARISAGSVSVPMQRFQYFANSVNFSRFVAC